MWTTHKCARLGPDKGTAGIKMEEPIYLHESEVKTKCKKILIATHQNHPMMTGKQQLLS